MDGFSVGKILAGLRNPEIYLKKLKQDGINTGSGFNTSLSQPQPNLPQNIQSHCSTYAAAADEPDCKYG